MIILGGITLHQLREHYRTAISYRHEQVERILEITQEIADSNFNNALVSIPLDLRRMMVKIDSIDLHIGWLLTEFFLHGNLILVINGHRLIVHYFLNFLELADSFNVITDNHIFIVDVFGTISGWIGISNVLYTFEDACELLNNNLDSNYYYNGRIISARDLSRRISDYGRYIRIRVFRFRN